MSTATYPKTVGTRSTVSAPKWRTFSWKQYASLPSWVVPSSLPWLASLVVNLAVVLVLALWLIAPPVVSTMELEVSQSLPTPVVESLQTELAVTLPIQLNVGFGLVPADPALPMLSVPTLAMDALAKSKGSVMPTNSGSPQSGLSNAKKGGVVTFYDVPAFNVRSVIFVIDNSGSMTGPVVEYGMEALSDNHWNRQSRWEAARQELIDTLKALPEEVEEFGVVMYNDMFSVYRGDATTPLKIPLFPVSDQEKKDVESWLREMEARGSTHPFPALRMAFNARPTTIFVLSDGEYRLRWRTWLWQLTKDNQLLPTYERVVINAVVVGETGSVLLKRLAKDNGGRYQFFGDRPR